MLPQPTARWSAVIPPASPVERLVEPLEARRLLAAQLVGPVLQVAGTDAAEEISVRTGVADDGTA